jgi:hypothetical protein
VDVEALLFMLAVLKPDRVSQLVQIVANWWRPAHFIQIQRLHQLLPRSPTQGKVAVSGKVQLSTYYLGRNANGSNQKIVNNGKK